MKISHCGTRWTAAGGNEPWTRAFLVARSSMKRPSLGNEPRYWRPRRHSRASVDPPEPRPERELSCLRRRSELWCDQGVWTYNANYARVDSNFAPKIPGAIPFVVSAWVGLMLSSATLGSGLSAFSHNEQELLPLDAAKRRRAVWTSCC
ncbi:hypothetical protein PHYPSEUDO_011373 [Phytophthora pseudosyringae]|uniref:Uncharacterized protein n=1 Tax=Phytophthora pseudosyringae TaxID=221518 RepID=A0A8T1V9J3_9STRA|nr:hypothetical protein PHYPSEUDO_011373 [Phytophthora pseudosyringae]